MRVVFVTPAWRRYDVTRVALAQRRHLCDALRGRGLEATCLVVADDDNLGVAAEFGFPTLESPNEPLGRKFNNGIEYACRELEADIVVPAGSDDWIHEDLFSRLPDPNPPEPVLTADSPTVLSWTPDAPEVVTGRSLAVVNTETGGLTRCKVPGWNGAIPWLIPRQALEPSGFRPVNDLQIRGIDLSLMCGIGRPALVFHDPHDLCRVDFKSPVNLNGYRETTSLISTHDEEDAWEALSAHYPVYLVNLAASLTAAMVAA